MTPEQKKEFDEIIVVNLSERGELMLPSTAQESYFYYHDVIDFMQAAHNAAVRKCADQVQKHFYQGDAKQSILQNLIEP